MNQCSGTFKVTHISTIAFSKLHVVEVGSHCLLRSCSVGTTMTPKLEDWMHT